MAKCKFHLTDAQDKDLIQSYAQCLGGPIPTRYQALHLHGTNAPLLEIQSLCNSAQLISEQQTKIELRLHHSTPYDLFGPTPSVACVCQQAGRYSNVIDNDSTEI